MLNERGQTCSSPNDTVTLKVLRPGATEIQISVKLGERPQQAQ